MKDDALQIDGHIKKIFFNNYEQGRAGFLLTDCKVIKGDLPRGFEPSQLNKLFYMAPVDHPFEGVHMHLTGKLIKAGPKDKFLTVESSASLPVQVDHIRNYIASGAIQYLGPTAAKNLVDKYGENTLAILDNNPEIVARDFSDLYSPGHIMAASSSWKISRQNQMEIKIFDDLDLTREERAIIVKTLNDRTHEIVLENPYHAAYYSGVDFRKIDSQIQSNPKKFPAYSNPNSTQKARYGAALIHVLNDAEKEGHTGVYLKTLVDKSIGHTGIQDPERLIHEGLRPLLKSGILTSVEHNGSFIIQKSIWEQKETEFCNHLQLLMDTRPAVNTVGAKVLTDSERGLGADQHRAVKCALNNHFCVITGGPGTGKTTTVNSIQLSFKEHYKGISLPPPKFLGIAPSGLAAQRMTEATGLESKTCHGALGVQPGGELKTKPGQFIDADVIFLDEGTMNSMDVMLALFRCIRPGTRVMLLGDVDQLPSVDAGNVFADLIESGRLPVARLNETFRFSENSLVYEFATCIKKGIVPDVRQKGDDWDFIEKPSAILTAEGVVNQFRSYVESGVDPYEIQIVTPLHKDYNGTRELNRLIQLEMHAMNHRRGIDIGAVRLQEGDRVMNLERDDRNGLSNGQNGICVHATKNFVAVNFDGKEMVYYEGDFHKVTPAWAKTIHKMQGSEDNFIIAPVAMDNKAFYSWQLLYTGLTRMKSHISYVGDVDVFNHAVNHMRGLNRVTGMLPKIQAKVSPIPRDLRSLLTRKNEAPSFTGH